jgi:hypothetical protein
MTGWNIEYVSYSEYFGSKQQSMNILEKKICTYVHLRWLPIRKILRSRFFPVKIRKKGNKEIGGKIYTAPLGRSKG